MRALSPRLVRELCSFRTEETHLSGHRKLSRAGFHAAFFLVKGFGRKPRTVQCDHVDTEISGGPFDLSTFADKRDRALTELWWVPAGHRGEPFMEAIG